MTGKQKYEQNYDKKIWEDSFFAYISNKTICLLCGYRPSIVKRYVIEKHYRCKHFKEYSKYVDQEKVNLIEGLKLVYQEGTSPLTDKENDATSSAKAVTASYAISLLIAKHSQPFTAGEFVKECIIEAVKSFGNTLTLSEAASIPLSNKTVASRVTHIASFTEKKLKYLLATCSYFSLCLNENTDSRYVSQLGIFARIVQNDFSCVEELLDFIPLYGITTGIDIFNAVKQTLKKLNTDFSKCSAIVSDSVKVMTGSKTGFFDQIKKRRDLKFPIIHRIIPQEILCGKAIELGNAMQIIAKIINVIKDDNKFLNHRNFQFFLEDHKVTYHEICLHSEVRWLSAGNCLENFFAIRKEIFLFLQEMSFTKSDDFKSFEDLNFLSELALLTDFTSHLNDLNLELQNANQTIFQLVSHVDSFCKKLVFMKDDLEKDILYYYPSCRILFSEYGKDCNFKKHLHLIDSLITEFNTRFSGFETLRKDLVLFENPLAVIIEEQNLEFQEELCDLQNDLCLKTRPEENKGIELFKILNVSDYPRLIHFGLRIFSMFQSTCLCEEYSFSKFKYINNDKRTCLSDASLSSLMRATTSKIPVDISSLVNSCKRHRKSN